MSILDPSETGVSTVGPNSGRDEDGRFTKGNNAAAKAGLKLKSPKDSQTHEDPTVDKRVLDPRIDCSRSHYSVG